MDSPQPQAGLEPPPGQASDFSAPNTLFISNIIIQTCVLLLTTSLVLTRCIVRKFLNGLWTLEDWLCLLSWALFVILIAMACKFVSIGGGSHQWNVPKQQMPDLLYWNNVCEVFYNAVILMTKLALLYMYLQIFAPRKFGWNWWAVVIVMLANSIFYTVQFFVKIYICVPRNAIWDKSITDKRCMVNLDVLLYTTSGWNTISDFMILGLPALFVGKLKMNRRKKIAIIAVFTVGAIAPIFSIAGTAYRALHASNEDQIYWQPRILLFSEAEISSGVICTCLPALKRLMKRKDKTFITSSGPQYVGGDRRDYVNLDRRRTRTLLSGSEPHYLESELVELGQAPGVDSDHTMTQPAPVLTNIAGGLAKDSRPAGSQIWKTTEVQIKFETNEGQSSDNASDEEIRRGAYLRGSNREFD